MPSICSEKALVVWKAASAVWVGRRRKGSDRMTLSVHFICGTSLLFFPPFTSGVTRNKWNTFARYKLCSKGVTPPKQNTRGGEQNNEAARQVSIRDVIIGVLVQQESVCSPTLPLPHTHTHSTSSQCCVMTSFLVAILPPTEAPWHAFYISKLPHLSFKEASPSMTTLLLTGKPGQIWRAGLISHCQHIWV